MMKQIIILFLFVLNLAPGFRNNKFILSGTQASAQNIPTPTPCSPCNGSYNSGGGNVYWSGSGGYSFGYSRPGDSYNYFAIGNGYFYVYDSNGQLLGTTALQDGGTGGGGGSSGGGGGGEGYGDEDGGFDWDIGWDIDDPWGDDPGDSGPGGGGPGGGQTPPRDCHGDDWGRAYENNCGQCVEGNTGIADTCTRGSDEYYLTLNNYATKYHNKDTIYIPWQQTPIKLTVHKESGPVEPHDYRWKRNDTANNTCNQNVECNFAANRLGADEIKIDSNNTKLIIKATLVTYRPPVIYFQERDGYAGEYGFDDSTHQYRNISDSNRYRAGYQIRRMRADTAYYVPWMSLLDKQAARVNIRKLWPDSALVLKDVNTRLKFVPTTNKIKINNAADYTINFNQLNTLDTLNIYAEQWAANVLTAYTIAPINAISITNVNDTIGRVRLSCAIPAAKTITVVYVNIGTGYDTANAMFKKDSILKMLNTKSHNQIFKKWSLGAYRDTLNISTEYAANPAAFASLGNFRDSLMVIYKRKTGVDIYGLNGPNPVADAPNKKYFLFITKHTIGSNKGFGELGGVIAVMLLPATSRTVVHEPGHNLKLDHTFDPPYNIPNGTTRNIMDYRTPDVRVWFGYFQWREGHH